MQNDSELLRQIFILRNNITEIENSTGSAGYCTRHSRWGSIYSPCIAGSVAEVSKTIKKPLLNIKPKIFQKK